MVYLEEAQIRRQPTKLKFGMQTLCMGWRICLQNRLLTTPPQHWHKTINTLPGVQGSQNLVSPQIFLRMKKLKFHDHRTTLENWPNLFLQNLMFSPKTEVYILQKYKFYSPAPQVMLRVFFSNFFLKSANKVLKRLKTRPDHPHN